MRDRSQAGQSRRRMWGLAGSLFLAVVAISAVPVVRSLQLRLMDSYFRVARPPRTPSVVTVVLIDDQSLAEYGRWPWSRVLLAQLTKNLSRAGAKVIGLDILLSEPQSADTDTQLRDAIAEARDVVLVDKIGTYANGPRWTEPLPQFARAASGIGHALAVLDLDGVCRRYPAVELSPDGPRWAFALEVARQVDAARTASFLTQEGVPFADNPAAVATAVRPVLVPVAYRRDPFPTISAGAALKGQELEAVRGRPVLVGFGPTEIEDRLNTPLSERLPTPGIEVHAQMLDAVLTGRTLHDLPLWSSWLLLAVFSVFTVFAFTHVRGWPAVALAVLMIAGVYGAGLAAFIAGHGVLAVGPMMLTVLVGPLLVYCTDFVLVERGLARQLDDLRGWLTWRRFPDTKANRDLAWRLDVLRELQQELGSRYELYQTLLEATNALIGIFDGKGRLLLKNECFGAAFEAGHAGDITLESVCRQMVPADSGPILPGTGPTEREAYVGEELYALRIMPFPATSLAPDGGSIVSLTSLRARVERDRARAEALGFITHELRTPLMSIQGFAEFMCKYPQSSECGRAPETIYREAKRLLALINGYLDVLRLDAGARSVRQEPVRLDEVVREVFEVLEPLAISADMRLVFDNGQGATLLGDPHLLSGATLNLLSNALKYGRQGTVVRVGCTTEDDQVVLRVCNEGDPIAPADLDRIFEAYYRSTHAQSTKPGWGLGLAFVKRIAEKHGGTVDVCSEAGYTCFELRLPARPMAVPLRKSA